MEEMLDPVEEQEIGDSMYRFEGGDAEIITAIQRELEFKAANHMNETNTTI